MPVVKQDRKQVELGGNKQTEQPLKYKVAEGEIEASS
jgi:hypothetical protein